LAKSLSRSPLDKLGALFTFSKFLGFGFSEFGVHNYLALTSINQEIILKLLVLITVEFV